MRALRLKDAPSIEAIARSLPSRGRFWLDGLAAHPEGRWAFVGAEPAEVRSASFGELALEPFDALGEASLSLEGDAIELEPASIPHWVGYIAYDAAWSRGATLGLRGVPRHPRGALPVVWLGRYERLLAIDLARSETFVLAPSEDDCRAFARELGVSRPEPLARVGPIEGEDRALHRSAIEHALDAIAAGDIYQVNLARRWRASFEGDPLALWLAMRSASPVPLGFLLELADHAVLARTMERFLRWERASGQLWTSPIKGTIARAGDDAAEAEQLRADAKEHAEHAMIVDLMRNDLSRVAEVGTVRVESALRVEPFAGLSHLVSTVSCRSAPGAGARAILEATFPPGSITGAPKIAAMELIEREERSARGVYTGAVGYVDRAGGLSLAVAIRTAIVEGAEVSYFAGGGLVAASDPDREIAETELKAEVFFEACAALARKNED